MCDLMNPGSCKVELEVEGGGEYKGLSTINEESLSFSWIWPRLDCSVFATSRGNLVNSPRGELELVLTSHT